MSIAHLPIQRVVIAAALASALSACVSAPVNAGYVSFNPARTDKVLIGAQAGSLFVEPTPIAGALHVEPFISPEASIPISLMGFSTGSWAGGTGRIGVRHRVSDWASVGGGAGGGFGTTINEQPQYQHSAFGLHLDLEASIGKEWEGIGISLTQRATLVIDPQLVVGYLPTELAVAFFLGRNVALTLHAVPTLLIPLGFGFAAGIGVMVRG